MKECALVGERATVWRSDQSAWPGARFFTVDRRPQTGRCRLRAGPDRGVHLRDDVRGQAPVRLSQIVIDEVRFAGRGPRDFPATRKSHATFRSAGHAGPTV